MCRTKSQIWIPKRSICPCIYKCQFLTYACICTVESWTGLIHLKEILLQQLNFSRTQIIDIGLISEMNLSIFLKNHESFLNFDIFDFSIFGILGFWDFGILGFWDFGIFNFQIFDFSIFGISGF